MKIQVEVNNEDESQVYPPRHLSMTMKIQVELLKGAGEDTSQHAVDFGLALVRDHHLRVLHLALRAPAKVDRTKSTGHSQQGKVDRAPRSSQ